MTCTWQIFLKQYPMETVVEEEHEKTSAKEKQTRYSSIHMMQLQETIIKPHPTS